MKKLLNVNKIFYILIFILIFAFITILMILINVKIEKSQSFALEVNSSGETNIKVDPQTLRKLKEAKTLYVNIDQINTKVTLGDIKFIKDQNHWIVGLKGITKLLPGEKIRVSMIYGYDSLLHSFISSGV